MIVVMCVRSFGQLSTTVENAFWIVNGAVFFFIRRARAPR
jgi:hypothetical protein